MSTSESCPDYAELFEKVTGETAVVDEQDARDTAGEREVAGDVASYVETATREDGLDDAIADPETD
jgi:hypothetical protein